MFCSPGLPETHVRCVSRIDGLTAGFTPGGPHAQKTLFEAKGREEPTTEQ